MPPGRHAWRFPPPGRARRHKVIQKHPYCRRSPNTVRAGVAVLPSVCSNRSPTGRGRRGVTSATGCPSLPSIGAASGATTAPSSLAGYTGAISTSGRCTTDSSRPMIWLAVALETLFHR